ncbi:chitinase [Cohnella sp. LGH]|nr:chitinase [Cohnella sp. LGH]
MASEPTKLFCRLLYNKIVVSSYRKPFRRLIQLELQASFEQQSEGENGMEREEKLEAKFETAKTPAVGQSRVLTDADIESLWGGIDPLFAPDRAVDAVQSVLPQDEYERLFPNRIGSEGWHEFSVHLSHYRIDQTDYYSYANLLAAVAEVANIKYKVEYRQDNSESKRIFRLDKQARTETLIYQAADFYSSSGTTTSIAAIVSQTVDFGSFIKEGSDLQRKRELAAFLANISHETGEGTATSSGDLRAWGLYWNEEIAYRNATGSKYVEENDDFPPVQGKSYHGRGPIQLSWNYNYGLISAIIYGSKDPLLQQPELIVEDGKLGFMTAILFWMTPQSPKPSAHDVMVGNWTPSEANKAKGLTPAGFGITIMIINGNIEGNLDESDRRIARRVAFYREIAAQMGVSIEGEKVNTLGMRPF